VKWQTSHFSLTVALLVQAARHGTSWTSVRRMCGQRPSQIKQVLNIARGGSSVDQIVTMDDAIYVDEDVPAIERYA
jgi:hypothetical protein